jgi:uncharacterized spore protein YtfJ
MAEEQTFDPAVLTKAAQDTFTVRRVFGEAYEHGGVTIIPVARVMGMIGTGAGGGEGNTSMAWLGRFPRKGHEDVVETSDSGDPDTHGHGHGGGGGFGTWVYPLGVYVVDSKGTHWQPAVDANLVLLGAGFAFTVVASTLALAKAIAAVFRGR